MSTNTEMEQSQEIVIKTNGLSRATLVNIIETHGNISYRYSTDDEDEVQISLERFKEDEEDVYEVEIQTAMSGQMLQFPDFTKAINYFFELVQENPCSQE